jgi:tripartite-type tricarboxylate transporter receptor subunit TctC
VATSTRFPSAPDVPTIGETLPGFALDGFIAVVTPSGTPDPIIDRLNREFTGVMKDPEIVAHLLQLGYATLGAGTRDQITATIRADRELWKHLAADLKIEPQ